MAVVSFRFVSFCFVSRTLTLEWHACMVCVCVGTLYLGPRQSKSTLHPKNKQKCTSASTSTPTPHRAHLDLRDVESKAEARDGLAVVVGDRREARACVEKKNKKKQNKETFGVKHNTPTREKREASKKRNETMVVVEGVGIQSVRRPTKQPPPSQVKSSKGMDGWERKMRLWMRLHQPRHRFRFRDSWCRCTKVTGKTTGEHAPNAACCGCHLI